MSTLVKDLVWQAHRAGGQKIEDLAAVMARDYFDQVLASGLEYSTPMLFARLLGYIGKWCLRNSPPKLQDCIHALLPFLENPSHAARRVALQSLYELEPAVAKDKAQGMLWDGSPEVRVCALRILVATGEPVDAGLIKFLLEDSSEEFRQLALLCPLKMESSSIILDKAKTKLQDTNPKVNILAIRILGEHGKTSDAPLVTSLLNDYNEIVRKEAFQALTRLQPDKSALLAQARIKLKDISPEVKALALWILGEHGEPSDTRRVTPLLQDREEAVRMAALKAMGCLWPEKIFKIALHKLTDPSEEVSHLALDILDSQPGVLLTPGFLLKSISKAKGRSVEVILTAIQERHPDQLANAVQLGLKTHDPKTRACIVEALQALERSKAGFDLETVLPLARDSDYDVREQALRMLARFDDQRVFAELVSSLNDVMSNVQETATELLEAGPEQVPVLGRYAHIEQDAGMPLWMLLRERVHAINRWASWVGQELLGRPVRVQQYRQGVGRTRRSRKKHQAVEIEVSDYAVTMGHPHGEDIMRGIALHEIGHHLADIGVPGERTVAGIARSEGVQEIYDMLRDERLERIMRSRRPEWGVYFDRLASQVFSQSVYAYPLDQIAGLAGLLPHKAAEEIRAGRLPGTLTNPGDLKDATVRLRDADLLRVPGALPLLVSFLSCLRCGFDPALCPDPRVRQAIALVPANLKDLPHGQVLVAARAIADIIGRSRDHKRRMKQWRQMLGRHRQVRQELQKILQRMNESGHLPEWMREDAPGIRKTPDEAQTGQPPEMPRELRNKEAGGQFLNLGKSLDFDLLPEEKTLAPNHEEHAAIAASVRRQIRSLRRYLERLGRTTVEEFAVPRGARLDILQARKIVYRPTANLLVHVHDEYQPELYMGVLIDRSGSMAGEEMDKAKAFAVLLAESAKGLPGISGHVNAFDDDTFYWLGDFRRCAVSALEAGGGNNDAGGLYKAASLALKSRKKNRLLIMISDGSPSHCSFESLKALVDKLTRRYGIVCAQVAVESMNEIAFPHFVDLSKYSLDEAVARFGRLLMKLTAGW